MKRRLNSKQDCMFSTSHQNWGMLLAALPPLPSFNNERDLRSFLTVLILFIDVPTCFFLHLVTPAPFGKHAPTASTSRRRDSSLWNKSLDIQVNAKAAWFLFECPTLVWSFYCFMRHQHRPLHPDKDDQHTGITRINIFLLSLFVLYYVNRANIYPI